MFKITLILISTVLLLLFAVSYHPSLEKYSSYFAESNSGSLFKATYLGTSSILISDGKTNILTDGFITRPSIYSLILTQIQPDKKLIKETLKKLNLKKIDAVISLHSHHDHAMDSAEVAYQTGAFMIGSSSTANIAKSQDFHNIKIIKDKQSFKIGDFKVTVIPSLHSVMGETLSSIIGINEEITDGFEIPAYFTQYKGAQTYVLFIEHKKGNIFINGSTNFIKGSLAKYKANTVFLGIANLGERPEVFQKEYFKEVVLSLQAKRVIPIHWDDFTKNINKRTRPMPRIFDDFDKSMSFLINQTQENNISLKMLHIFDSTAL